MSDATVARAQALKQRFPASAGVLDFCALVAVFRQTIVGEAIESRDALVEFRSDLVALVNSTAPDVLRREAENYDDDACRRTIEAYWHREDTESPCSVFARILLGAWVRSSAFDPHVDDEPSSSNGDPSMRCLRCRHAPGAAVLRPQGDGQALSLVCSLCEVEWPSTRGRCPACGANDDDAVVVFWGGANTHVKLQACERCRRYLHTIDLAMEPSALPLVDELVALPLDIWAAEASYRKLQVNLAGI